MDNLLERYKASMILSGVGDAMGFKNGNWEFCHSGLEIHKEANKLGGIEKLKIKKPDWLVSDDTVLHLATAESYMEVPDIKDKEKLYSVLARKYKDGMRDMNGRSAGLTTMNSCHMLRPGRDKGYQIPFNSRGGGCGAAMRSMCIGLRYPKPEDLDDLISDSIESGRMTHHHPTGYLGSLAGALFTSYALQEKPVEGWGAGLVKTLDKAKEYINKSGHEVQSNLKAWDYFENAWKSYLKERNLTSGTSHVKFPVKYDVEDRDKFYKELSYGGWGGASGHDAPMIAYDALLGSKDSWIEVCKRGILHSGDNDSTGVMIGAWFGALYGFFGVPDNHHQKLEYRDRLERAGEELYQQSQVNQQQEQTNPSEALSQGNTGGQTNSCETTSQESTTEQAEASKTAAQEKTKEQTEAIGMTSQESTTEQAEACETTSQEKTKIVTNV